MTVFDEIRAVLNKHKEKMPVVVLAEILADIDGAEAKWNDGWIPFTQREMTEEEKEWCEVEEGYMLDCPLPEDDEEILVTYANGTVDVDTFMRDGNMCYLDSGNDLVDEAVAWMKKPAPYKKGNENGKIDIHR